MLATKDLWSYTYELQIPATSDSFLISQFMNGGIIYVDGKKLSELPKSSETHKYIWFRPHMVFIPPEIRDTSTPFSTIRIESASYLRYLYVMPIYAGSTLDIQILFDVLLFVSRIFSVASSIVSLVAGVLLLMTWSIKKQDRLFLHAGAAAITWALLYLLLNFPMIPSETVKFFRFTMYLLIAVSIYNLAQYVVHLSTTAITPQYERILFIVSSTGPIVYILSLGELQDFIDKFWIAGLLIVSLPAFFYFLRYLVKDGIQRHKTLGAVLVLGFLATYRDAQFIGFEQVIDSTRQMTTWDLLDAPMLVSYIIVPLVFIFSAGRLLQNYQSSLQTIMAHNSELEIALQKRELQLRISHLEDIRKKQRDITEITRAAIHRDLHDGIGSRLVATTYALRSGRLTRDKLELSLLNCLKDIRSIMQSESDQEIRSLQTALFEYCADMEEILSNTSVQLTYSIPEDRDVCLIGNRSGEILKMTQELLSNALKHSTACQIHIALQLSDSYFSLTVTETAFDSEKSISTSKKSALIPSSNTGLKSLELRAQSIGASFLQKVNDDSRTSYITLRMFVDRFVYLADSLPSGREERRMFLNSQISDLT